MGAVGGVRLATANRGRDEGDICGVRERIDIRDENKRVGLFPITNLSPFHYITFGRSGVNRKKPFDFLGNCGHAH